MLMIIVIIKIDIKFNKKRRKYEIDRLNKKQTLNY
jgi:hypothetical protein